MREESSERVLLLRLKALQPSVIWLCAASAKAASSRPKIVGPR